MTCSNYITNSVVIPVIVTNAFRLMVSLNCVYSLRTYLIS